MKMTLATLPVRSPFGKVFSGAIDIRFPNARLAIYSQDNGNLLVRRFLSKYLALYNPDEIRDASFRNSGQVPNLTRPTLKRCTAVIDSLDSLDGNERRDDFDGFYSNGILLVPGSILAYQPLDSAWMNKTWETVLEKVFPSLGYRVVAFDNLRNAEVVGNEYLRGVPARRVRKH